MGISEDLTIAPNEGEKNSPHVVISHQESKIMDMNETEEREEGEIIDEFEDIISSDEELSMKRRIEELEERNLELEKIANISAVYNYGKSSMQSTQSSHLEDLGLTKDRFDLKALPVSDISDNDEFYLLPPPKPPAYKVKRSRTTKNLSSSKEISAGHFDFIHHDHHQHERKRKRTTTDFSPEILVRSRTKNKKKKYERISKSSRSRKKSNKIRKKIIKEKDASNSSSEDEFYALNRDELRFALKRDIKIDNKKGIIAENLFADKENFRDKSNVTIAAHHIIDLSDNLEKVEKQPISNDEQKDDSDDSISLEEQELRLIALKSAILKKAINRKKRKESEDKKPYSPTEFVELRGNFCSPRNSIESGPMDISPAVSPIECTNEYDYNKPIDMDLVGSNSSSPILVGHDGTWIPIDKIPIPKNSSLPNIIHSPIPISSSPSPPNNLVNKINDLSINNNYDAVKIDIRSSSPELSDEEELALRALLLSNMQKSKRNKAPQVVSINPKQEDKEEYDQSVSNNNLHLTSSTKSENIENTNNNDETDSAADLDPEALKQVLLLTMIKERPMNKTELVLKEAVKRLKSQTANQSDIVKCQNKDEQIYLENNTTLYNSSSCDMDFNALTINKSTNIYENNQDLIVNTENLMENSKRVCMNEELKENHYPFSSIIQPVNNNDSENFKLNNLRSNLENLEQVHREFINNESNVCMNNFQINEQNSSIQMFTENIQLNVDIPAAIMSAKMPSISDKVQNPALVDRPALKAVPLISDEELKFQQSLIPIEPALKTVSSIPVIEQPLIVTADNNTLSETSVGNQSKTLSSITQVALKTVPIEKTPQTPILEESVKAINIPKMKTKVIRTRTKVVNKIIAQNLQLKRKVPIKSSSTIVDSSPVKKKAKVDIDLSLKAKSSKSSTSRLITTVNVPIVQKVVIQLGKSDSESDGFDDDLLTESNQRGDYFDNASPMSLPMDSPCYSPRPMAATKTTTEVNDATPTTTAEVQDTNATNAKKSIVNDIFQARLDEFLKKARDKVDQIKKVNPIPVKRTSGAAVANSSIQSQTPSAVRHLPPSSQLEYRRLVSRMKILEKQKQAKTIQTPQTNLDNIEKIKIIIKNDEKTERKTVVETNENVPNSTNLCDIKTVPTKNTTVHLKNTTTSSADQLTANKPKNANTNSTENDTNLKMISKKSPVDQSKLSEPSTAYGASIIQNKKIPEHKAKTSVEKNDKLSICDKQVMAAIVTNKGGKNCEKSIEKKLEDVQKEAEAVVSKKSNSSIIDAKKVENVSQKQVKPTVEREVVAAEKGQPVTTNIIPKCGVKKVEDSLVKEIESSTVKPTRNTENLEISTDGKKDDLSIQKSVEIVAEKETAVMVVAPPQKRGLTEEETCDPTKKVNVVNINVETPAKKKTGLISNQGNIVVANKIETAPAKKNESTIKKQIQLTTQQEVKKAEPIAAVPTKGTTISETVPLNKEGIIAKKVINPASKVADLKEDKKSTKTPTRPQGFYDIDYKKNSIILSENITKALQLVEVAKEEKMKKLLLQCKFDKLKDEMIRLETQLEQQNKNLSKIYPQISEHHKNITELKTKCLKFEKSSKMSGGKVTAAATGSSGRSNESKCTLTEINDKYKEFALEIRNLKYLNVTEYAIDATTNTDFISCDDDDDDGDDAIKNTLEIQINSDNLNKTVITHDTTTQTDFSIITAVNENSENFEKFIIVNEVGLMEEASKETLIKTSEDGNIMDVEENIPKELSKNIDFQAEDNSIDIERDDNVLIGNDKVNDSNQIDNISNKVKTSSNDCNVNDTFEEETDINSVTSNLSLIDQSSKNVDTANEESSSSSFVDEINTRSCEQIANVSSKNFNEDPVKTIETIHFENNDNTKEELNNSKEFVNEEILENVASHEQLIKNKEISSDQTLSGTYDPNINTNSCNVATKSEEPINIKEAEITLSEIGRNNSNEVTTVAMQERSKMEDILGNNVEKRTEEEEEDQTLSKIEQYISPLVHLRETRHFNPNGIICPFQLMGQCDDQQCKYEHLPKNT